MTSKRARALVLWSGAGLGAFVWLAVPDLRAYRRLCELTRECRPAPGA